MEIMWVVCCIKLGTIRNGNVQDTFWSNDPFDADFFYYNMDIMKLTQLWIMLDWCVSLLSINSSYFVSNCITYVHGVVRLMVLPERPKSYCWFIKQIQMLEDLMIGSRWIQFWGSNQFSANISNWCNKLILKRWRCYYQVQFRLHFWIDVI